MRSLAPPLSFIRETGSICTSMQRSTLRITSWITESMSAIIATEIPRVAGFTVKKNAIDGLTWAAEVHARPGECPSIRQGVIPTFP
jgi:hypothetical protein